jgi:hypothetical protein
MVSATNPQQRVNNPADAIGAAIQMSDACIPYGGAGNSAAQALLPSNGEYGLTSMQGTCNYSLTAMPKLFDSPTGCCCGGCASAGGGYPFYQRNSYSANKTQCCMSGSTTVGGLTCDPSYNTMAASTACNDVFTETCTGALLSTDDPNCTTWCENNPAECDTLIQDFCTGSNLSLSYCQTKLQSIGGADTNVEAYCVSNPNDPFCSCINAVNASVTQTDSLTKEVLSRPECYVTQCASGAGYKTTNMRTSGDCPPVNVCVNTMNVVGDVSTNLTGITQNCDQTITQAAQSSSSSGNTTPTATTTTPTSTTNSTSASGISDSTIEIIVIIFIIVIIIGLGLAYWFGLFDDDPVYVPVMNNDSVYKTEISPNVTPRDSVTTLV